MSEPERIQKRTLNRLVNKLVTEMLPAVKPDASLAPGKREAACCVALSVLFMEKAGMYYPTQNIYLAIEAMKQPTMLLKASEIAEAAQPTGDANEHPGDSTDH